MLLSFICTPDAIVSFTVTEGTILEGDSSDFAEICLDIVDSVLERTVQGSISISDIGNAGIDSMF